MLEASHIDSLFNSVDMELAKRWTYHNVPAVFIDRPATHLRTIVTAWWHLYQEANCARRQQNRLIWERNLTSPAQALETLALVTSLREIQTHLDVRALLYYRPLSKAEESGIGLLTLVTSYYANPLDKIWMQIL